MKKRGRKPGTSCSGPSGCGTVGNTSPFDPGVELTRSRVDEAASAAGVEFPGVRVEDPVALGGIELPRLRVHGTAILGKGWDGRHRGGGWLVNLRLGPLRYRRRRGLENPWRRFRGQVPGGLPHLGCSPARQKEQRQCQGGASVKIASFHIFIMVPRIPFVKGASKNGEFSAPNHRFCSRAGQAGPRFHPHPPVILCLICKRLAQRIAGTCRFPPKGHMYCTFIR